MDMGQYDPLLVTDDQGVALGYAMIWLPRARNGALLEYLGVLLSLIHILWDRRYHSIT